MVATSGEGARPPKRRTVRTACRSRAGGQTSENTGRVGIMKLPTPAAGGIRPKTFSRRRFRFKCRLASGKKTHCASPIKIMHPRQGCRAKQMPRRGGSRKEWAWSSVPSWRHWTRQRGGRGWCILSVRVGAEKFCGKPGWPGKPAWQCALRLPEKTASAMCGN